MALTGDLRNIGLADLFQTLNQNRATGVLEVSNKSSTKKFLFTDAGVTLISRRTLSGFRAGKRLIGLGKVTSEEIEAALALQASDGGLIGAILVANGNCTQEEIQEVIRYHVAEELFEVFTWTEGIFSFHEGGVPSEDELAGPYSTVSLDPAGAILDAARRIDECQRAWTVLPTRAEILVRTAGTSEPLDAETYSAEVRALYDLIDGARTIEEVLSSIFISQFEAVPTLVEMVDQGLIRKRTVTELKSAASVFSGRDEGESAARCLQAALAEPPDDLETLTNLCAVCEKLSDKKQAAEILKRIAQLHHGKKDLTAAAADLTKAARYAPGSAEIQEQLAMVRQQANDLPGAIQAFLRAGEILNDQGSFKQAMDICTLALHLDSDNVDLHRILANSHVGAGEIDEAVEELIQIVPSIEANGSRGQIEDIYRKILKLDSSRREYLARLERVTIEGARKRKRIRLAAISGAAVLILAAVAVVVAPSGTSLVEQLAQATSMMASGDLRGAERSARSSRPSPTRTQGSRPGSSSSTSPASGRTQTVRRSRHGTNSMG